MAVLWLSNCPGRGRETLRGSSHIITPSAIRLAQAYTESEDFDDYKAIIEELAKTEGTNDEKYQRTEHGAHPTGDEKTIVLGRKSRFILPILAEKEDVKMAFRRSEQQNPPPLEIIQDREEMDIVAYFSHAERIMLIEGVLEARDVAARMGKKSVVRTIFLPTLRPLMIILADND